ncbi:MAG TPA: hypothetical protein VGQ28_17670 [Thermoanaerobaculia bacterium]|nr:hypothetical protein [Thermoanaerobaculia bacterium]
MEAPTGPAALIAAHPGHELRVHGWLERARPEVFVLTDGSGHAGTSRLPSTAEVLGRAGARQGFVFGRYTDRAFYELLLAGRAEPLADLARELAAALVASRVERVVCDAAEGFNPSHDLCRLLAGAASALAAVRLGRPIACFDHLLEGSPEARCTCGSEGSCVRLVLDDAALDRKLAAAEAYPELRGEVERALALYGPAAFRVEHLRPADPHGEAEDLVPDNPGYERHGAERVAAGHYRRVLRRREHFLPIARALREIVASA